MFNCGIPTQESESISHVQLWNPKHRKSKIKGTVLLPIMIKTHMTMASLELKQYWRQEESYYSCH